MNKQKLIELATSKFKLDVNSTHGLTHWQRVEANGLLLARSLPGANVDVITHFAYLHDACREDEGEDPEHGQRAAEWVKSLWFAGDLDLTSAEMALLYKAIRDHNKGYTSGNQIVGACWDADRRDLGRVGITPAARFLCTQAAKDMLTNMQARPTP